MVTLPPVAFFTTWGSRDGYHDSQRKCFFIPWQVLGRDKKRILWIQVIQQIRAEQMPLLLLRRCFAILKNIPLNHICSRSFKYRSYTIILLLIINKYISAY